MRQFVRSLHTWGYLRRLVWFLTLCFSTSCFGQAMRIRIINARNGHPLPKQQVFLSLLYEKNGKHPTTDGPPHHLETDAKGEAHFILPEPAPAHLGVQVRLTSEYWHCACVALVTTQDVVEKGIAQPYEPTAASAIPLQVKPGEVLFVVRPFTFLEHLLYPFVKE